MTPVSICIITKNVAKYFADCLASLEPFLQHPKDEIIVLDTGSTDNTVELAKKHGARTYTNKSFNSKGMLDLVKHHLPEFYDKCAEDEQFSDGFMSDFSAARNESFKYAKNEIIFWLDADDILKGGAELRDWTEKFFSDKESKALFLPYEYSFQADGACETILWRERLIRKGAFYWKGACHEVLIPADGSLSGLKKIGGPDCCIHHKHGRHHLYSDIRNYVLLLQDYEKTGSREPRLELYLGNAARGLANGETGSKWYQIAVEWYMKAQRKSGSRDDRYSIFVNIGYIHLQHGRAWRAIDYFNQASKIYTADPRAYFGIAHAYLDLKRYKDCLQYLQFGRALPVPDYVMSVDPLAFDYYPAVFEFSALKELKEYEAALRAAQYALQLRPNHPTPKAMFESILVEIDKAKAFDSIVAVTSSLVWPASSGREILQKIRPEVRKQFPEFQLEQFAPPPQKSITFFCGLAAEPWDYTSLVSGIGGSEQMVLRLSEQFAKKGWNVDIYGNPPEATRYHTHKNVTYRPYQSFNTEFKRDILIIWRSPALLDVPFQARKIYVDMHDVSSDIDWTEPRLKKIDGIFFKSKFHRNTAPGIPEDKVIYSRNGIDLSTIPELSNGTRNHKKLIWLSAPDRGLLGVLRAFQLIKRRIPDAELHVYYGFGPLYLQKAAGMEYEYMGDEEAERHMYEYMEDCHYCADQIGAVMHGRLGHTDLMKEQASAGLWIYPTKFPEISCISAMEAQANGVLPVCSKTGALAETVDFGKFIEPNDTHEIASTACALIEKGPALDDYRKEMREYAIKSFNIETLADDWIKEFVK